MSKNGSVTATTHRQVKRQVTELKRQVAELTQDCKNLSILHDNVEANIREWSERTGKVKKPPYPADAPCYYCSFNPLNPSYKDEVLFGFKPCDYCIHNPEARIYGRGTN